jgi:hypothetical protein
MAQDDPDPAFRGSFQVPVRPGADPDPDGQDRAEVMDLVLDPEGNVLVAYGGDRGIWRIDPAGGLSLHALLPDDGGGDIQSLTLDPASGDLQVRDAIALWRVTPTGEVTPLAEALPGSSAPGPALPAPAAEPEGKQEARPRIEPPDLPPPGWGSSGPDRRGGLFCLALLGLGVLADPSLLGVAGQTSPASDAMPPPMDRYTAEATAVLGRMGPVCAAPLLLDQPPAPCDQAYRARVLDQVDAIRGQMRELYVDPAVLGPGACQPGASRRAAKASIALDQSDIQVAYDALNADALALMFQLNRDGLRLYTVGQGLLSGQALGEAATGATPPEAIAAFAVQEVATSLLAANQGLLGVGDLYGKVANVALSHKAKYQRYANNQTQAVLHACTSAAPAPAPAAADGVRPPPAAPLESPTPALADAVLKLTDGCSIASQHHLDLPVCSLASLSEVSLRNGTLGDLFQGIACLASGVTQGRQSFCPNAPLADSRARSDTFAFFDQFYGEINAAAADAFACGNGLGVAAASLELAVNAAELAGDTTATEALQAGVNALAALGSGAGAEGWELLRIGSLSRRWLAEVTLAFNVASRTQLEGKEAKERLDRASSSTGVGPGPRAGLATGSPQPAESSSSGGAGPDPWRFSGPSSTGGDSGVGLWPASGTTRATGGGPGTPAPGEAESATPTGSPSLRSSTAAAEPATNAATRTRPFLGRLKQLFLPAPPREAPAREEF